MNWKIIVGGLLIFAGIAQFLKIFTEYHFSNSMPTLIGMGVAFIALVIIGVFLVRDGRKQNRSGS